MIGITGYGCYLPRYRLDRKLISQAWGSSQPAGEIAVANYDEDALTMGTEAALQCFGDGMPQADALYFASTSAPYAEKQVASVIATACDLPRKVQTADFTGSVRAGMSALLAAVNAVRAGARQDVVVVAADNRTAAPESELEGLLGDAAGVLRVGGDGVLAEIVDVASVSEEFTHLWRMGSEKFLEAFPGKFSNTFGYVRDLAEAIEEILSRQQLAPDAIAHLAVYSPDMRAAADLAKKLRLDPKRQLVPPPVLSVGSAGVADPFLGLAAVLDEAGPGEYIVVAGYGEGADAVLLRTTDELSRRRAPQSWKHWVESSQRLASYEKYLKFRRIVGGENGGEAINNVLEFKELKQDIRMYGSRCESCGTVQFPLARVCIKCKGRDCLVDQKLTKEGTVFTFTVDHLIANIEHPLPMAVVELDGGGRLYLQVTDFDVEDVEIGLPVRLTFRRLHDGGGNHNYFWKVRPRR
jgi:3-hydroxy-3-methylglutaryl CoA synthase